MDINKRIEIISKLLDRMAHFLGCILLVNMTALVVYVLSFFPIGEMSLIYRNISLGVVFCAVFICFLILRKIFRYSTYSRRIESYKEDKEAHESVIRHASFMLSLNPEERKEEFNEGLTIKYRTSDGFITYDIQGKGIMSLEKINETFEVASLGAKEKLEKLCEPSEPVCFNNVLGFFRVAEKR